VTGWLVAADAAFYSAKNEAAAKAKRVKRVCIANRSTKSAERKARAERWFRDGQKWRTGCEGVSAWPSAATASRVAVTRDSSGMSRWVALGVIADNIVNIGCAMEKQTAA
jgi:IS5 family transposase